jgi:hypothetical protein
MPGQSFTTMDSDAYCDTCPDVCYVDFNDDGIPDAQENQTSSAAPSAMGSNSTVPAFAPTPVVVHASSKYSHCYRHTRKLRFAATLWLDLMLI